MNGKYLKNERKKENNSSCKKEIRAKKVVNMVANLNKQYKKWKCPLGSAGKESACNAGDPGSIPGSGRSPGEGIGYPLQYS